MLSVVFAPTVPLGWAVGLESQPQRAGRVHVLQLAQRRCQSSALSIGLKSGDREDIRAARTLGGFRSWWALENVGWLGGIPCW